MKATAEKTETPEATPEVPPVVEPSPAEIAAEEVQVFVLHEQTVTTINGEVLPVPKICYGREIVITEALKEVMKRIVQSDLLKAKLNAAGDIESVTTQAESIAILLTVVFEEVPHALGKISAALLEKDEKYVLDNFESEALLGLVLPFLSAKSKSIGAVFSRHAGHIRRLTQGILT